MKRKFISFLFTIPIFVTSAQAQLTIGPSAGITNNFLKTNINSLSYTKNQTENGLIIDLPVQYAIKNGFFLETAFTFLQKNYSYRRTGPFAGIYTKFTNTYCQLPVTAGREYGHRKIRVGVLAGVYGAYWLQGRMKGKIPNIYSVKDSTNGSGQTTETFGLSGFNEKYVFDSRKDRRFEFGLTAGLCCAYFLHSGNCFTIVANYSHAITDQQKNYMVNQLQRLNQTFAVCVGYRYQLIRHLVKSNRK